MSILIDNTSGLYANYSLYFDFAKILYNKLKFFGNNGYIELYVRSF